MSTESDGDKNKNMFDKKYELFLTNQNISIKIFR